MNVGNCDAKGLNVNNNWDDNRNGNVGLAAARQFSLSTSDRPDPAAEHTANFINDFLENGVLLIIQRLRVFHEADKYSQKIQLEAGLGEGREFF